jgi:hypothetical protein
LILELLPFSLRNIIYNQSEASIPASSNMKDKPVSKFTTASSVSTTMYHTAVEVEKDATTHSRDVNVVKDTAGTQQNSEPSPSSSQSSASCSQHFLVAITASSSLSMLQVLKISIDIADGLRYLHEIPLSSRAIANAVGTLDPVLETDVVTNTTEANSSMSSLHMLSNPNSAHHDTKAEMSGHYPLLSEQKRLANDAGAIDQSDNVLVFIQEMKDKGGSETNTTDKSGTTSLCPLKIHKVVHRGKDRVCCQ